MMNQNRLRVCLFSVEVTIVLGHNLPIFLWALNTCSVCPQEGSGPSCPSKDSSLAIIFSHKYEHWSSEMGSSIIN